MQLAPTFTVIRDFFAISPTINGIAGLHRLARNFKWIVNDRGGAERAIISRYAGRPWDDCIERELNKEIADYWSSRF
jgi:hypothetical protein